MSYHPSIASVIYFGTIGSLFFQILIMAYRPPRSQQSPNAADHRVSPSPPPSPRRRTAPVAPIGHWTRTIQIDQARKTNTNSEHNESEVQSNGNTQQRRRTEPMLGLAITFSCRKQRTKYTKGRRRWVRVRHGKTLSEHDKTANKRQILQGRFFAAARWQDFHKDRRRTSPIRSRNRILSLVI